MPARLRHLALSLVVGLGACGFFGDQGSEEPPTADQAGAAATDTAEVTSSVPLGPPADLQALAEATTPAAETTAPDSSGVADSVAVGAAVTPAAPGVAAASQVGPDLEARLEQIIENQEAINLRLDSLSAQDGAAEGSGSALSTAVLGEAGESVRSFTVAVVLSIITLIIFNVFIRITVWVLDTLAERNASRRLFYKRLVPIVRIVLWVFAVYLIVRVIFRIDAQGIVAGAAAIGVAVGFAAQDLLKNLFGGLILIFDQPFQVGDKVSVEGTYGEVVSIGLRATRIVTPDDNRVTVPNAQLVDQQVANANAGELNCQVVTDLFLPGWADEAKAKRIAFEAAAGSKYVFLNKPIVVLVSDVFKETFLTRVRVKAYVLDPRLEFLLQSDVTERARAGFRDAGLLKAGHMWTHLVERSAIGIPADAAVEGNGGAPIGTRAGDDDVTDGAVAEEAGTDTTKETT